MIDLRVAREEPDLIRASLAARGMPTSLADELLAADATRRATVTRADTLRAEQKTASKRIGAAAKEDRPAMVAAAQDLAGAVKAVEEEERTADAQLRAAALAVPNLVEEGVPSGGEEHSVVIDTIGPVPTYDFPPKDHVELGRALKAIDIERGVKVSGARFYFLTGVGAELEFALLNLAMDHARTAGFIPMVVPSLVRPEAMEGTGFLGAHAEEVYRLADDDLYLVGTSEVALAAYHSDEVIDLSAGPIRYAGWSSCFRREAGSYGKDTKGIIRVHWFDKVEMFVYCTPEQAVEEHRRLLAWEQDFLGKLELSYQVLDIAAGDLGSSATRKFDCEAWFASQGDYRELTSTSNCTTYQSRRLGIRYRDDDGKVALSATLNGTLCAIARTIACLLEHHQRSDGSVHVPVALRPYLGGREVLEPVAGQGRSSR